MCLSSRLCGSLCLVLSAILAVPSLGLAGEWQRLYPPLPVTPVNDIHQIDAQTLLTVGDDGAILRTADGGASWTEIRSGTPNNLNALAFANGQRGIAVGDLGTLLLTRDGGLSWERRPAATIHSLHGAHFVDALNGWAVGLDTSIVRTSDGGETWTLQYSGLAINGFLVGLMDVHFVDTSRGWAVGNRGTVLHTSDGGGTWVQQPTGQSTGILTNLNAVFFIDAQTGWTGGTQAGTNLWRTTDGGGTWEQVSFATSTTVLRDIDFVDAENGWLLAGNRTWRTMDGGGTWEQQAAVTPAGIIVPFGDGARITFSDTSNGWVAGGFGYIARTGDGGETWEVSLMASEFREALSASFLDASRGWVGTMTGQIFRTTDGGATWVRQPADGTTLDGRIESVLFLDDSHGWALGAVGGLANRTGRIYRTTDGGSTWSEANIPDGTRQLNRVDFASPTLGIAAGVSGTILRSADGGANWEQVEFGSTLNLTSVRFSEPGSAWIVGGSATLLNSTDGGQNWNQVDSGLLQNPLNGFRDIDFVDPSHGWILGTRSQNDQFALQTTDGGQTWTEQSVSYNADGFIVSYFGPLFRISFADRSHGWATGMNGHIARTTDGGQFWLVDPQPPHSAPTDLNLSWVRLLAPDHALVVDSGGNLRSFRGAPPGPADAVGADCGEDGWCYSEFYGWFSESGGWIYHQRHGWQFFGSSDSHGMVLYDAGIGAWIHVSWLNPDAFHAWPPVSDWLLVDAGDGPGHRMFYSAIQAVWRTEADFGE
ncbi:MAG: hypothetical protein JJU00_17495 [Opitutales bacterium]|nr:hypothetical protein [Opitutales bacterium]